MQKRIDEIEKLEKKKNIFSKDINVFTCCVGRIATQAKYFVSDSNHLESILDCLIHPNKKPGLQNKIKKALNSTANLRGNFMFGNQKKSPDVVKTKFGGVFTRHGSNEVSSKVNRISFG